MSRVVIVVIGRNEGARLRRCLASVFGLGVPVVYVDSGSTDTSVRLARASGTSVVELDPSMPFSAGRARNEGLARAAALCPNVEFVQFVDGDCEVVSTWLALATSELDERPDVAAVCGRIRERDRERSVYNRLCDIEWQDTAGEATACGGNAMVRVTAFREVGGFRPGLIAGEEPELCLRLRRLGWKIWRNNQDMVRHDADMLSFGQWWRRCQRAGWGYAESAAMHGVSPERHCVRDNLRILFWGAVLPFCALALAWPSGGRSLALAAAYPLLALRIYSRAVRSGLEQRDARLQSAFMVLAKFPQVIGLAHFVAMRALGRRRRVVDWRVAS